MSINRDLGASDRSVLSTSATQGNVGGAGPARPLLERTDSSGSKTPPAGRNSVVSFKPLAEKGKEAGNFVSEYLASPFGGAEPPLEFRSRLKYSIAFVASVTLFLVGVVALSVRTTIINKYVEQYVIVDSDTAPLFEAWADPASQGIEQWRCFTFFNITNANATWSGSEVPNFELVGPYCYEELLSKDRGSIKFSADGASVEYSYRNYFHFDPAKSQERFNHTPGMVTRPIGDEDDEVIIVNLGIYGLQYRFQDVGADMGGIPKSLFCDILDAVINAKEAVSNTSIFVRRSVREILWGYTEPIWEAVQPELTALSYVASSVFLTEWNGSYPVPSPYTFRSGQMCPLWGDINGCNSTTNMLTRELTGSGGYGSYKNLGQMTRWAGQEQTWWWGPELETYTKGNEVRPPPIVTPPAVELPNEPILNCNQVSGTNAMRWGPVDVVHKEARLTTFLDLFWRSVDFVYDREASVKDIPALRFTLAESSMDNSTFNQECFQAKYRGIFNFSRPMYGPVYAAKNMMLDVEIPEAELNFTMQVMGPKENGTDVPDRLPFLTYLDVVLGRAADPDNFRSLFDSYLDVNPLTGVSLRAMAQGMAFTDIHPIAIRGCPGSKFAMSSKLLSSLYPLVVVHRTYDVPDTLAGEIRDKLRLIRTVEILMGVATLVGFFAMVTSVVMFLCRNRRVCGLALMKDEEDE